MVPDLRQRKSSQSHTSTAERIISNKSPTLPPKKVNFDLSLLTRHDLPSWSKDNSYIRAGRRSLSNSYILSFRSCIYIHNEEGNIYSHLLAALWMISLPIFFYPYAKHHCPDANADDWIVFGLFFLGGALFFGLSTAYHVLASHSHAVHDIYHRLDLPSSQYVSRQVCDPPSLSRRKAQRSFGSAYAEVLP